METSKEISTLYFNTRDELFRVDLNKVLYFKADRNYSSVYFQNGRSFLLPANLMAIENMLSDEKLRNSASKFARIGRSIIVNISHIAQINVVKQELLLGDMSMPNMVKVVVSKDALHKLKDVFCVKQN